MGAERISTKIEINLSFECQRSHEDEIM